MEGIGRAVAGCSGFYCRIMAAFAYSEACFVPEVGKWLRSWRSRRWIYSKVGDDLTKSAEKCPKMNKKGLAPCTAKMKKSDENMGSPLPILHHVLNPTQPIYTETISLPLLSDILATPSSVLYILAGLLVALCRPRRRATITDHRRLNLKDV